MDSSQLDSSLLAYLSAEHDLATKRLSDFLGVLVERLFLIYCPLQQVAYHFLIHIVHEPSIAIVCSLLQHRKEFASCDKVITQQQMRYILLTNPYFTLSYPIHSLLPICYD